MRFPLASALLLLPLVSISAQSLVITNKNESTASIITLADGKTVATLPTGDSPHEVAVSHDGKWAVATDYGAAGPGGTTLTLIDIAKRRVDRTIPFGNHVRPHGAAFLPDNRTLVVTAERGGALVLVDVVNGTIVKEIATGQMVGHMVALSPDSKTAYVANISPGTLSIIDLSGAKPPVTVKVGTQTEAIGASPDGKMVWLGSNNTGKVYVVDVASQKVVDSVQTSGFPYRIGFTPNSRQAIITNPMSNEIWFINAATRAKEAKIDVVAPGGGNAAPFGLIISPKGERAWVTMNEAGQVAEIDLSSATITRWMATGQGPDGIGYVP